MLDLRRIKNETNRFLYTEIVKRILFKFDPEKVHNFFIHIGKGLDGSYIGKKATSALFNYQNKKLEQKILGIRFRNPVGLSAGFDKDAKTVGIMEDVGFGFAEIGSITAKECKGNSGKRLRRMPEQKGLWVNMGLNNDGADAIKKRIHGRKFKIPIAISIAKTNCKETADAKVGTEDYIYSLKVMKDEGDYFDINISCPNAYGGQPFSDSKLYEGLMKEVKKMRIRKPIFVKMSPDLSKKEIDSIIRISRKYGVKGFVISNLTKNGLKESGGYSGKMVQGKAEEMLKYVYGKTKGEFVLIGVGGIFSADDAYRKIKLGANLVQLVTGMIFQGPGVIGEINYELVKLLERDGYKNIGEAVGKGI